MAVAELEPLTRARTSLADEWRERNPQTPEQITAFYRESAGLRDDLDAWHQTEERQLWTRAVVAAAGTINAGAILDVGCGLGHDLRAVRAARPGAYLCGVEPNAELRIRLVGDGYEVWENVSLVGEGFDLINCIDVFEHVPNPERLLAEMIGRLRMGGILVEATATNDIGTPLHLRENRGWSPGRLLDRYGFTIREQLGRLRIWQRVQERRGDEPTLLLCAYRSLTAETAECLMRLGQQGWRHAIHRGDALISRVRSIAVSQWLREEDGDVFLMIDDDIVFSEADAQKVVALAREREGIACGAYPVRGGTHLALRTMEPGSLRFGPDVPPVEIRWAGTGFLAAHRKACEAVAETMPLCHPDNLCFWPMFQPCIWTTDTTDGDSVSEYLSEDWAFCERARQLGYRVWLDPSVQLTHLGQAEYTVATMRGAQVEA